MDNIQYLLVLAMLLVVATIFFPVEGRIALTMRLVNGGGYGAAAVILILVIANKLPSLGWFSKSMSALAVLAAVCLVKMFVTLGRGLADVGTKAMMTVSLAPWSLYSGSTLHRVTTSYYLKGQDKDGNNYRFRISRKTFQRFFDVPGQCVVCVCAYAHTKIIIDIKVSGGFENGKG